MGHGMTSHIIVAVFLILFVLCIPFFLMVLIGVLPTWKRVEKTRFQFVIWLAYLQYRYGRHGAATTSARALIMNPRTPGWALDGVYRMVKAGSPDMFHPYTLAGHPNASLTILEDLAETAATNTGGVIRDAFFPETRRALLANTIVPEETRAAWVLSWG